MRTSTRTEAALHCCVVLGWAEGRPVSTATLAGLFELPAAYLNKTLQLLARGRLIESVPGVGGGFRITRRPTEVTLMDIVAVVEGRDPLFRCNEIRQHGRAASPTPPSHPCAIAAGMRRAELAYRKELAAQTLAELMAAAGPGARRRTLAALAL